MDEMVNEVVANDQLTVADSAAATEVLGTSNDGDTKALVKTGLWIVGTSAVASAGIVLASRGADALCDWIERKRAGRRAAKEAEAAKKAEQKAAKATSQPEVETSEEAQKVLNETA